MTEIKEFDRVALKDGREGTVVETYGGQDSFDVDIGSSPADWETITVKRQDIDHIIND